MTKLRRDDLERIRKLMAKRMSLREGEATARVTVHMGTCGIAAGARKIMSAFLAAQGESTRNDILITTSGCAGLCSREPMATVEIEGEAPVKYVDLDEKKVKQIFEEHVLSGRIVEKLALAVGSERVG
ncbi:MAG: (2Fe-2S) ferredoxin domain-containing protein [Acidobacteriota bacterium]|nr:(2Fe-2S) ferredoxin domain-containing protein [Acidobacteriota bacterium]